MRKLQCAELQRAQNRSEQMTNAQIQTAQKVTNRLKQSESGTAYIRFELESSKAEVAQLMQNLETLRAELERSKKENSEVCFRFDFLIL